MKTRLIFRGHSKEQSFDLEIDMTIQPADKTILSMADVDRVPDWVASARWYVKESSIYLIGDAVTQVDPRMLIELRPSF